MKTIDICDTKILRRIEEKLQEKLTVNEIAGMYGYSEFHFAREFRKVMGMSVMQYVNRRRLINATELILHGSKIIDAALQYGWQSPAGFTKAYIKEFGFSPSVIKLLKHENSKGCDLMRKGILLSTTEVHANKEQLYEQLLLEMNENQIAYDENEFRKIYNIAEKVYSGIKRDSGDEYITHPLNVAIILAQSEADLLTIETGLFCDAVCKTGVGLELQFWDRPFCFLSYLTDRLQLSTGQCHQ